jgi:putative DNA primase/helicase
MPAESLLSGPSPGPAVDAVVARLAKLGALEYDQVREREAKALGVRAGTLDDEVKKRRRAAITAQDADFGAVEPWDEPVDGTELLEELRASFRRFIVLPNGADTVLSLWSLMTYAIDYVGVAPILAVVAPEKRCGKTTALDVLSLLVNRPLATSNISTAALFRSIEKWTPTLLIDEFDSFLRGNDELRGVLNSGHTRQTAFVLRCVGDEAEPKRFSTWGPKAVAGIGELPATLADRSLPIRLRRALPDEAGRIEKLRHADKAAFNELARKAARWVQDNGAAINAARPTMPDQLSNRAADNAEPLLAIATAIGSDSAVLGRSALLTVLCADSEETAPFRGSTPNWPCMRRERSVRKRGLLTMCLMSLQ